MKVCIFNRELLTDEDIEEITLYLPSTCESLYISDIDLTETAVSYIAENLLLRGNSFNLKRLSLYDTKLTDEGVTRICCALIDGSNRKLEHLDVQINRITAAGAREIARMLEVNQGLKTLNIGREGLLPILNALRQRNRTLKILDITGSIAPDEDVGEAIARISDRVQVLNFF